MLLLEASRIEKQIRERTLFTLDSLTVYSGDRIGIIGRNGSGKSTLLNILSGNDQPDAGFVRMHATCSYIRQQAEEDVQTWGRMAHIFDVVDLGGRPAVSGGEQTRIRLANALSEDAGLVLADEPTANLDEDGIEAVVRTLSRCPSFLLVTHDRDVMNRLCTKILELDDGRIKVYEGNYDAYRLQKDMETDRMQKEYDQYIQERSRLRQAIRLEQGKSKSIRNAPRRMGNSEARLHRRSANEKREKLDQSAKRIQSRLEHLDVPERPRNEPQIHLDFRRTDPPGNKVVVSVEDLTFRYGDRVLLSETAMQLRNGSKTALMGDNGCGKTTLLRLIAGDPGFENDAVRQVPKARVGFLRQDLSDLNDGDSILDSVLEHSVQSVTTVRTVLAHLLFRGDDVYKRIGVLSGGERVKVAFARLFVSGINVLLLDEPTNYLDIASMEALEEALTDYEGTVLFVSHDRTFVQHVADTVLVLEDGSITKQEPVPG